MTGPLTSFDELHGDQEESSNNGGKLSTLELLSSLRLRLVSKKIPLRYCKFNITNTVNKMLQGETLSVAPDGATFYSSLTYDPGCLMRLLVEVPDYWARKSKHVDYRHTEAPSSFQMLCRVVTCEDVGKRPNRYLITVQTVNIDPIDGKVLADYLGVGAGAA
ncbi:MAG: hypothetical protein FJY29_07500 [Betaproteobacteria bacterium]|nr:hypothetical protein [Betaproteobacteria bacterium]